MVEYLKKAAEVIKQRIRSNLDKIHENEDQIKKILKEPVTPDRTKKLDERFKLNKKLINENNFAIRLQKDLITYIEVLQNGNILPQEQIQSLEENRSIFNNSREPNELRREDYLELTKSKDIDFDSRHPYYNDPEFLNSLLEYYISTEDYETCATLKQITRS